MSHAKANLSFFHLNSKAETICSDGLSSLCSKAVQCISITGMGGKLIAEILTKGKEYLNDATLVLSAHTDLPIVRRTLQDLHYHIVREHVCRSANRFYIVWKAEPGSKKALTDEQLLFGTEFLTFENEAVKEAYVQKSIHVLEKQLSGLNCAKNPDHIRIEQTTEKISKLKERFVL